MRLYELTHRWKFPLWRVVCDGRDRGRITRDQEGTAVVYQAAS